MDEKAIDRIRQNAALATDFIREHPNSGIKTVEDFHRFIKNNPGTAETWTQNKKLGIADLASAFQDAESLDRISNARVEEPQQPQKNPFAGLSGFAAAPLAPFMEADNVKLAKIALTEPTPNINLYDFVPTEISQDQDFRNEFEKVKEGISQEKGEKYTEQERDNLERAALARYNISAERADKIRLAREHDIYLKDANGNIVGEKIFKDKKGRINPYADPVYASYQRQKQAAIYAALEKRKVEKKQGVKPKYKEDQLRRITEIQYDGHFAAMFPEKAAAYSKLDQKLELSLKSIKKAEEKRIKKEEKQAKKTAGKAGLSPKKSTITKKAATEYIREFNNHVLLKKAREGYDRSSLARKLRELKTLSPREKPQGSEAINREPKRENREKSHGQAPRENISRVLRGENPYSEWTSPRSLSSRVWSKTGINRKLGQRFGNGAAKKTGKQAVEKLGSQLAKKAASQAVQAGAKALLVNPISLVVIGIILLIIIVVVIIIVLVSGGNGGGEFGEAPPGGGVPPVNANPIPGFTLTKSVSSIELPDPSDITYTISYSNGTETPTDSITIYDTVPQNTTLIDGTITGKYTVGSAQDTISWALSDPVNQGTSSFSFSVLPTTTDVIISNFAFATSDSQDLVSSNNCSGYYSLNNPRGNFGDPNCNFATSNAQAKNDLYILLKQLDPSNADYWYLEVIPCESSYNPNAYNPNSYSGNGAYGLYQMNPRGKSTSGSYDIGDIIWTEQTNNAVNLLKEKGRGYWDCF